MKTKEENVNAKKVLFHPACFSGEWPSQLSYSFGTLTPLQTTCPVMNVVVRNLNLYGYAGDDMVQIQRGTFLNRLNDLSGYSRVLACMSYQFFLELAIAAGYVTGAYRFSQPGRVAILTVPYFCTLLSTTIAPHLLPLTFVPHYCPISLGIAHSLLLLLRRFSWTARVMASAASLTYLKSLISVPIHHPNFVSLLTTCVPPSLLIFTHFIDLLRAFLLHIQTFG
jgi:hypothetical protein